MNPRTTLHRIVLAAVCLFLASGPTLAQSVPSIADYTALGDAAYAKRLGLSDSQTEEVANILSDRRAQMATAERAERQGIIDAANTRLASVLTEQQRAQFAELVIGGKLRFNFRNEPWQNVLEWFATQADLALVMNEAPPGDFTYTDAKNHTPSEAVDLLNSVLQSKGFTLVRREKMLIASRTSDSVPYDMVPKVQPEDLPKRGKFELVTVVFPLEGRPVDKVSQEVAAFLGTNGRATPLPATGQIMVVDTAGRVEAIRQLIASIPKPDPPKKKESKPPAPKPPAPVFQVHAATGLSMDATMETLKSLYENAKITGDRKAEQITVFAPPNIQSAVSQTLKQMTANISGINEPRLEIYSFLDEDIDQIRNVLAQTVPGIQISADPSGERLLIVGDAKQHAAVENALEKMEAVEVRPNDESLAIYDVDPELANQVSDLLQPLIPRASIVRQDGRLAIRGSRLDQQIAESAIGQLELAEASQHKPTLQFYPIKIAWHTSYLETLNQVAPEARITSLEDGKQLAVVASTKEHERITAAISEIVSAAAAVEKPRLRFQQLRERLERSYLDSLRQIVPTARITEVSDKKQLAIVATQTEHEQIVAGLQAIEAATQTRDTPKLRFLTLQRRLERPYLDSLKQLAPEARISEVPNRNQLSIVSTQDIFTQVETAVGDIEQAASQIENPQLRFFSLKRKLERPYLDSVRQLVPDARITEVPNRNQLAIVATQADFQEVVHSLQQVQSDVESAPDVELQKLDTSTLHDPNQLLSSMKRKFGHLQMMLNQTGDQLLVWTDATDWEAIQAYYEQTAAVLPAKRSEQWAPYSAGQMKLDDLRSLLEPIARSATFRSEPQRKRLMVLATDAEHQQLQSTLRAFQGQDEVEYRDVVMAYALQRSDPNALVTMLQDVKPDVRFAADEQTNRILVTAPLLEQAEIKAIIDQLDSEPGQVTGEVARTYSVKLLPPSTVISLLQPTLPKMRMTPNDSRGSLAVVGSERDHQRLEVAIAQLDGDGKNGEVVSYSVADASPRQVRSVLQQLVPRAIVSVDERAGSVVVWTDAQGHDVVRRAVEQFTQQSSEPRQIHVYPINRDKVDASDVLKALDDDITRSVSITVNRDSNSLIVSATTSQHKALTQAIEAIVNQLPDQPKRVSAVYQLQHADPDSVEFMLRDLIPDARYVEDDAANTLAVSATPENQERIAQVIEQLDLPPVNRRTTEIYRFDRTEASSAADVFDRLAPRARISRIRGSNSVIATATEAEHHIFREATLKMKGGTGKSITRVYPLDKKQIDVEDVLASIDDTLRGRVAIRMNEQTNSLMVRGSAEDQETLKQLIDEIIKQVPAKPQRQARVYQLDHASAETTQSILGNLFPDARFTQDAQTGALGATALPEEHSEIERVIAQLDVPGVKSQRSTEIYRFDRTSIRSAVNAFEGLAPRARIIGVNGTNSVMATATADEHKILKEAAQKLNGGGGQSVTKVYAMDKERIDAEDVLASIDDQLKSRIAVRINEQTNSLIVRGNEEDQQQMKQLVDQMLLNVPPKETLVGAVYPLKHTNSSSIRSSLRTLFDDATFGYDNDTQTLVVTASAEDQAQISEFIQKLDQPPIDGNEAKIYHLDGVAASRIYPVISGLVKHGQVTYDDTSNVIVVTATEHEHSQVQSAINELNALSTSTEPTEVYTLKSADPANVQMVVERLIPNGRVANDRATGTLIVAANEKDQEVVSKLIEQIDAAPGQEAVMRAYIVRHADGPQVFQSLSNTFNGNGNYSLSYQDATKTVFVVATPKNHSIFQQLIQQLDAPTVSLANRRAQTYPLGSLSATAGRTAVTELLKGTSPAATVEIDTTNNALVVVGTDEQHAKVTETFGQLASDSTELEVFELDYVDPWTVENAIDSLFANVPVTSAPSVSSDYTSQRIFVRGTGEQLNTIKSLLRKLGEPAVAAKDGVKGDVRTIPFHGDVHSAIDRIKNVWPKLRRNRIQVISPADSSLRIDNPRVDDVKDDSVQHAHPAQPTSKYVALQTSTRAPEADDNASTDAESTVVIVPEGDRVTIASSDHAALDQLEALLRAMSRNSSDTSSSFGADFAVYLLRNTGASDMRQLLAELFEQLRKNQSPSAPRESGGFQSLFGPDFSDVAVVADDRLNALIIHGDRTERELIQDLLEILDSEDLPNPIVVYQPELVTLKHTQADRVLKILKNVYRSQMQSGGGRKKVDIPEGVSADVASVLQQINAAAGAPILTLDIDDTTNSIVMRAPPELRQEIKAFVSTLDMGAGTNRSRNVRVIRLHRGKADQIRDALEQFVLQPSGN